MTDVSVVLLGRAVLFQFLRQRGAQQCRHPSLARNLQAHTIIAPPVVTGRKDRRVHQRDIIS
jgi:hypothetical protein